jgi:hypothetical protein
MTRPCHIVTVGQEVIFDLFQLLHIAAHIQTNNKIFSKWKYFPGTTVPVCVLAKEGPFSQSISVRTGTHAAHVMFMVRQ